MATPNEKRSRRKLHLKGTAGRGQIRGLGGRARAGSFLLSRTAALSARIRRSFGFGLASGVFCSSERMEGELRGGIVQWLLQRVGFRETVSDPIRKAVASGACESGFFAWLDKLRRGFLHTRARFFGIAGTVFSLYAAGIFFLRRYMALGFRPADPADLGVAAGVLLISLLLLLCGKPLNLFFAESRLFSRLFVGMLGVCPDAWRPGAERVSSRGGLAFIAGTAAGIGTLWFRPHWVLLWILAGLFCACIPAVPEMGLLSAVLLLPLMPLRVIGVLIAFTFVGYVQKFFRLKRVLRFRLPELFLTLTVIAFGLAAANTGDLYVWNRVLLFACMWYLTVCLMMTGRLFRKYLAAVLYGGGLLLLIRAFRLLTAIYVPGLSVPFRLHLLSEEVFGCYLLVLFPIALLLGKHKLGFSVLVLIAVNLYFTAEPWLLLGMLSAVLLYAAFAHGAWAGSALTGALTVPATVFLLGDRLGALKTGFSAVCTRLASQYLFSGIGSGSGVLLMASLSNGLMPDGFVTDLYTRLTLEGGLILPVLFVLSALCALQRTFSCLRTAEGETHTVCGTLAASVLLFLAAATVTNVWADLRLLGIFWCLCPAATLTGELYGYERKTEEGVWQWI